MNEAKVKAAAGRLVRHPRSLKRLPVVGDAADPVSVDLDDPFWFRRLEAGDVVVIDPQPAAPIAEPPVTEN